MWKWRIVVGFRKRPRQLSDLTVVNVLAGDIQCGALSQEIRKEPMDNEILLVRDGDGSRVLFGHLRLSSVLTTSSEVTVNVKGEQGRAKIVRTEEGLHVAKDNLQLPLLKN
jgi:hypothetical protein